MAVNITKKFWNGTEYKSIAKIVFTSPNFTSPAVAGTRSHMPPGGIYMGTWYEAVDWMYRQKPNQDYVDFSTEMESFFGKLTLSGTFDFNSDTSALFTHTYGEDYHVVSSGSYPNVLYRDKDNYGVIGTCTSGTISGTTDIYTADITFSSVVGTSNINEWIGKTASGTLNTPISGDASPVNTTTSITVAEAITVQANNATSTVLTGSLSGNIDGTLTSEAGETVSGTLTNTILSKLIKTNTDGQEFYCNISPSISVSMVGHDYGTASDTMTTTFSGLVGEAGDLVTATVSDVVVTTTSGSTSTVLSGTVSGDVSAICQDAGDIFVSGTLIGAVSGNLIGSDGGNKVQSTVTGNASIYFYGEQNSVLTAEDTCIVSAPATGVISGTLNSAFSGDYIEPSADMYHQYSDTVVNADTILPRTRRQHGGNSMIFAITFGEAYSCRLTAWDDDTHATTSNKILTGEHYKIDAAVYRSNLVDTSHEPVFRTNANLVYPQVYDIVLKGNELYYGDFDLVFAIETDQYGDYLAFIPRLINMDSSFVAGNYDFVTTLHYQYT